MWLEPHTTVRIRAEVGLASFAEYALTMDLPEGELLDVLADNRPIKPGSMPLRDKYLPTIASVVALPSRLCTGGVVGLYRVDQTPRSTVLGNSLSDQGFPSTPDGLPR